MITVIWTGRATAPELAVPCGICGATVGRPCTTHYASGNPCPPHQSRADHAEALGFRWAPGAEQRAAAPAPMQGALL
jgi:hypothetical protein